MANNEAIQILRGTTDYDPKNVDFELKDGQPFYSKKNRQFYVGDPNLKPDNPRTDNSVAQPVGAANLIPNDKGGIRQLTNNNDIDGGDKNTVINDSVVFGKNNTDTGYNSLITGQNVQNSGYNSFLIGGEPPESVINGTTYTGINIIQTYNDSQGNGRSITLGELRALSNSDFFTCDVNGYENVSLSALLTQEQESSDSTPITLNKLNLQVGNKSIYNPGKNILTGNQNILIGKNLTSFSFQDIKDCNNVTLLGENLRATNDNQLIVGKNNGWRTIGDTNELRFAVGTGTEQGSGTNGFEVYQGGNVRVYRQPTYESDVVRLNELKNILHIQPTATTVEAEDGPTLENVNWENVGSRKVDQININGLSIRGTEDPSHLDPKTLGNQANGRYSFAGGQSSTATSNHSFAYGWWVTANGDKGNGDTRPQVVFGKYNAEDKSAYFIIGNGTGDNEDQRRNLLRIGEDVATLNTTDGLSFNNQAKIKQTTEGENNILTIFAQ